MKELRKVQLALLEMLKDVDKLCKKNNIKYFLDSGTLLGAVRHKGFIPWDDDIDIGMLREDFDLFIKIVEEELKEKYIIDKPDENLRFIKIRSKSLKMKRPNGKIEGIFFDIFPFDFYSENAVKRLLIETSAKMKKEASPSIKLINYPQRLIFKIVKSISKESYINLLYKLVYETTNKSELIGYGKDLRAWENYIKYDDVFPLKSLKFEDKEFYVPKNYETMLISLYGENYMELPKEKDRVVHAVEFINEQEE